MISVNAMVSTPEVFEVWRDKADQRFLPPKVSLRPSPDGELQVGEEGEGVVYGVKVGQSRSAHAEIRPWWFKYRNHPSSRGISYPSSRVSDSDFDGAKGSAPER